MATDATLNEIKRGDEAKRILENPIYQEAVQKVRDDIVYGMTYSALGDSSTHTRLVIALQLLGQIEKQLQDVMTTGRLANLQVQDKTILQKIFG